MVNPQILQIPQMVKMTPTAPRGQLL